MNLLRYELKKLVKNRTFLVTLIVSFMVMLGMFLIGFYYSQLSNAERNNADKGYSELYQNVSKKHEGNFNDEKVKEIISDYMELYQGRSKKQEPPFDLFSMEVVNEFAKGKGNDDIYLMMNDAMEKGEKISVEQVKIKSLKEVGFDTSNHFTIGKSAPWHYLFSVTGMLFILISLLSIIVTVGTFSNERESNMYQLILTTKYGRNKMIMSKMLASNLLVMTLFVIFHLITFCFFYFYYYGMDGWNASIQTDFIFRLFDYPVVMNNLTLYLLLVIFQFFAVLAIVSITLLISSFAKSTVSALIIAVGSFFLPLGLIQIFRKGMLNELLYIFPINLYNPEKFLTVLGDKSSFILSNFSANLWLVILIFIITKFAMNTITFLSMKKKIIY